MNDAPFCLVVNIGVQLVMFVGALLNTYLGTKSMSIPFLVKTNQFEEVAQARECALADMIPIIKDLCLARPSTCPETRDAVVGT